MLVFQNVRIFLMNFVLTKLRDYLSPTKRSILLMEMIFIRYSRDYRITRIFQCYSNNYLKCETVELNLLQNRNSAVNTIFNWLHSHIYIYLLYILFMFNRNLFFVCIRLSFVSLVSSTHNLIQINIKSSTDDSSNVVSHNQPCFLLTFYSAWYLSICFTLSWVCGVDNDVNRMRSMHLDISKM